MGDLTSSDWIAIASGSVALCALGVSFWHGHVTSRHNRLSARPHILIDTFVDKSGIHSSVFNVGLGPATIDAIKFALYDRQFDFFSDEFAEFASLFCHPGTGMAPVQVYRTTCPAVVAAGRSMLLFKSLADGLSEEHIERVCKLLPDVMARVEYRSMYGERFVGPGVVQPTS